MVVSQPMGRSSHRGDDPCKTVATIYRTGPATSRKKLIMISYLRKPRFDAVVALLGRCLIAYVFIGAAVWHLRTSGWQPTISDMQSHGVPMPQLLLIGAMAISSLASLALLLDWRSRGAAYSLAGYTLVVSSVMHNPAHAAGAALFLYIKDLGLAGALMAFGASTQVAGAAIAKRERMRFSAV